MKIHKGLTNILRLSDKEQDILNTLSKQKSLLISDISKNTNIPRMTLYPFLTKLKERGLINYRRLGKRKFWYIESSEKIANTLTNLASFFTSEKVTIKKEESGFTIHRNLKSIYSVFEEVSQLHKGERVKVIQPTNSALNAIRNLKVQEEIGPINQAIIDNGIIVEGLLQENYYTALYKKVHKENPQKAKEYIEGFIGRSADMVFIPKEYLNIDSEFLMFQDKAFIINWKDKVAIEIQNKDMINFFGELFDLARGYGKKIDQNQYLKNMMTKINNNQP